MQAVDENVFHTILVSNSFFAKHLALVFQNATQSHVALLVYVINSNCFVAYITSRTKNRIVFCVNIELHILCKYGVEGFKIRRVGGSESEIGVRGKSKLKLR